MISWRRMAAVGWRQSLRQADWVRLLCYNDDPDRENTLAGRAAKMAWVSNAVMTALITSPGKNGVISSAACEMDLSNIMAMPATPGMYRIMIPPTVAATPAAMLIGRACKRSMIQPVAHAAMGKPTTNPTLGPARTPKPPRPPDSNGSPASVSAMNNATAAAPRFAPKIVPAIMIPILCAVIGTPLVSISLGISPKAAIRAANRAM